MTSTPAPPSDWPEAATKELNGLHDRLHRSWAAASAPDEAAAAGPLLEAAELELGEAEASLARALHTTREERDRAWEAYAHAVVRASATLGAAQAQLDSARAQDEAAYRVAAEHEIDAWQQLLDEGHLQAHLAGLEARDHLEDLAARLGRWRHALASSPAGPDGGWQELRAATRRAAGELRDGYARFRATHGPSSAPSGGTTGDRPA